MHELIPDAKLIYLLRDPVDRAVRQYVEHVHLGIEHRSIDDAFADPHQLDSPYLCSSRYASQLERFRSYYPDEQILVLDYVDLRDHRAQTLRQVFSYLGVDPTYSSPEFTREHNTGEAKVNYNRFGRWLVRHQIGAEHGGVFRRGALKPRLRALTSTPIAQRLSPPAHEAVTAALQPEVDRLRDMTGRAWSQWSNFPVT